MNKSQKYKLTKTAITETKQWIEKIVIAYNICPFAKSPFDDNTIYYTASCATSTDDVIDILVDELLNFDEAPQDEVETALLIFPRALANFDDYNQFLDIVDAALEELDLVDVIQVDSFHPDYCFADYEMDDVRSYSNRSIYPMFQLKRVDSMEYARATYPDVTAAITTNNMDLLSRQGLKEISERWESCLKDQTTLNKGISE